MTQELFWARQGVSLSYIVAEDPAMQVHILENQSFRYEGVLRIIQRYFFLFLNEDICCDPSLEPEF